MSLKLIHSYIQTFLWAKTGEKELKEYPWTRRKKPQSLSYNDDAKEEEEAQRFWRKLSWKSSTAVSILWVSKIPLWPLTVRGNVRGAAAVAVGRLGSFDVEVQ